MKCRICSLLLLAVALVLYAGAPLAAAEDGDNADKNTHVGTFVSAKGETEFTMKERKGEKEHGHTLAPGAKVYDADGKECHLSDLKKGQRIRVTTKEGDMKVATKVEALKRKKD